MTDHMRLTGGPADGLEFPEPNNPEQLLGVPLDEDLNPLPLSTVDYYALATYGRSCIPDELDFLGAKRRNIYDSFQVEFIDGPLRGSHDLPSAPTLSDDVFRAPLNSDRQLLTSSDNKVAAIAEYKRRRVGDRWKMALAAIVDAPDEIEKAEDHRIEQSVETGLSEYTIKQLINELMRRDGFLGVVVMHARDYGLSPLGKSSHLSFHRSPQLNWEESTEMLNEMLDLTEGMGEGEA